MYVKQVMKLLAFIFEQSSYNQSKQRMQGNVRVSSLGGSIVFLAFSFETISQGRDNLKTTCIFRFVMLLTSL